MECSFLSFTIQKQVYGGAKRDRTVDLLRARQALSKLSYGPITKLVGLGRFELPTSPLSGVRSNQLSYRPNLGFVLLSGRIDLTLLSGGNERPGMATQPLWRAGLRWIGSASHATHRRSPIPLATAALMAATYLDRFCAVAMHSGVAPGATLGGNGADVAEMVLPGLRRGVLWRCGLGGSRRNVRY